MIFVSSKANNNPPTPQDIKRSILENNQNEEKNSEGERNINMSF